MGGVPFCMPGHAGLDVFSPARHIRRGGEDRGGRGSWKGGSWSPLSLPSPKDCTRMSEISIYVHTMYKPVHTYVCFVGVLAPVYAHAFMHMCMHSAYVFIRFVHRCMHACICWYTYGHENIALLSFGRSFQPGNPISPQLEGSAPHPSRSERRCRG